MASINFRQTLPELFGQKLCFIKKKSHSYFSLLKCTYKLHRLHSFLGKVRCENKRWLQGAKFKNFRGGYTSLCIHIAVLLLLFIHLTRDIPVSSMHLTSICDIVVSLIYNEFCPVQPNSRVRRIVNVVLTSIVLEVHCQWKNNVELYWIICDALRELFPYA